ncbi:hypothetical protein LJC64_04840 [Ruminococcaceae bacterium OttesenSCG-928-A11]|nr:hypothetical protein [Ruminococcaceae bacterium OttesenSCG-928-A11]
MKTRDPVLVACLFACTALRRSIVAAGVILGALCGLCIWGAKGPARQA